MYRLILTAVIYSHANVGGEIITPSGCPVLHTNVFSLAIFKMVSLVVCTIALLDDLVVL